jgi:hypothetical protein
LRWALLLDHWYQHNQEYLNGSMTLRAFPEIRVGYRLDIAERHESYYVESVQNRWQYPNAMTTTVQLSRGQRNDPFPVYVYPASPGFNGIRGEGSRLGEFFKIVDLSATAASSAPRARTEDTFDVVPTEWQGLFNDLEAERLRNEVDDPLMSKSTWAAKGNEGGYENANYSGSQFDVYDQAMLNFYNSVEQYKTADRETWAKLNEPKNKSAQAILRSYWASTKGDRGGGR